MANNCSDFGLLLMSQGGGKKIMEAEGLIFGTKRGD